MQEKFDIMGKGTDTQVKESAAEIMTNYIDNLTQREKKVMELSTTAYFVKGDAEGNIVDRLKYNELVFKNKKDFIGYIKDFENNVIGGIAEKLNYSRYINKYEDGFVVSFIVALGHNKDGEPVAKYVEFMVSGDFD